MALKDKIKKRAKPSVSMWFLFVASSVIIIFFLWYFLIYVNGNEKLLIQKSFRVLTQIGENFKEREKSFRGLTESDDMKIKLCETTGDSFSEQKRIIKKYFPGIEIDEDSLDRGYFYFSNI